MTRVASGIALMVVLMLVIDPYWCEDGCTDRPASQAGTITDCAACQRSVPPASIVVPVTVATIPTIVTAEPTVVDCSESWYPDVEHPPRRA